MLKSLIPAVFLCCAGLAGAAVHPDAGTTAFSFLRSGAGARAVGMGGAYTAVSDDIASFWYNPAGIAAYPELRIITGYRSLWAGGQAGVAGVTKPLGADRGSAGLLAVYERSGGMDETDLDGNIVGSGKFYAGSFCLTAAYAKSISGIEKYMTQIPFKQSLQVGGAVKFIQASIMSYGSFGVAVDLGVRYVVHVNKGLTFGAALQHLGTQLTPYYEETAPLPVTLRAGISYPLQYLPLLLSYDAVKPSDNYLYHTVGGEFTLTENLCVRAGFSSADRRDWHISDDEDTFVGTVLGAGFRMNGYAVDAAYTPSGQLGSQIRFSIGRTF